MKKQFCEIILNLDLWFRRRCCLKDFLSGALAALMFSEAEPCNFGSRHYGDHSCEVNFKFGPVFQEMVFNEKVNGHTADDGGSQ